MKCCILSTFDLKPRSIENASETYTNSIQIGETDLKEHKHRSEAKDSQMTMEKERKQISRRERIRDRKRLYNKGAASIYHLSKTDGSDDFLPLHTEKRAL